MNGFATFETGGHKYRINGKLNAIQQLHVVRRLAPLVTAFVGVDLSGLRPDTIDADPERTRAAMGQLIGPLSDSVAKMPDADTEYVLAACMRLVQRDMGGGTGWSPMWNQAAGAMQYDDLSFMDLITILGRVLMANVGDFGSALPLTGGSPGAVLTR